MHIDEWTSDDGHTLGGGEIPPCAGLASSVLPEAPGKVAAESSHTGVSTSNAPMPSDGLVAYVPSAFSMTRVTQPIMNLELPK